MNEEKVTYAELKLAKSKKPKNKRNSACKKKEFPWHIIAVILGILCIFLLLATIILIIRDHQKAQKFTKLNCSEGNSTISPPEVSTHSTSPAYTDKQISSDTCYEKWSCYGKDCYYFSKEEKSWDESKKSCEARHSLLIKIDDKDEQKFIQQRIKYNYWVGLYRKGMTHPWLWQDGVELSRNLSFLSTRDGKCGYIKLTTIATEACTRSFRYICEKKFTCLEK